MESRSEIVSAYLQHYRTKDKSLFWAWDRVEELTRNLDTGLPITLALIEAAEGEEEIAYVAAGPLEELLQHSSAAALAALEAPARNSSKVRFALANVWLRPENPAYSQWQALSKKFPYRGL